MSKKKLMLVGLLPNGDYPGETWCLDFSTEEEKIARKSIRKSSILPVDFINLVQRKINEIDENSGIKKVVLPEFKGEAPKGTKLGKFDTAVTEVEDVDIKTFPEPFLA